MGAKTSKNQITPHDRAILDLKGQRDQLKRYQKKLSGVLERETTIAKEHLRRNDKRRALLALRKKKYQEQLLNQTEDQLANLEQLTQAIEFALVERDVFKGLAQGNEVLKELHKEMSLDAVERLIDETAEGIAYQNEIEEMLSGKISDQDEAEIEQELDTLLQQQALDQVPAVPSHPLPVKVAQPEEAKPVEAKESSSEEAEDVAAPRSKHKAMLAAE
ncbi:Vacuolar protein sorting-associated protein 20 [Dimargaris verticillata]|uniref:Vacuolar protein sorting-associated protein 20 n=1 Tax=Dimargaris verticillata TaxID=2761393 RepID=A0A9W8EC46_9FUNG|nr:Vacuolar protein sorting-associated protein 20 [Dimargaris verticillata]